MASLEPLQDRKIRAFVQTSPTTIDVHTIRVDLIAASMNYVLLRFSASLFRFYIFLAIVIVPRDIPELSIKSLLGNGRDLCMWTTHRNQNNSNDSVDVLAVVTSLQRNFASVVAFSLHGNVSHVLA